MNSFFKVPQAIYTETEYKSLSLAAKTAYMFLADRQSYSYTSIAKGDKSWIDSDGNVYCIMTNLELVGLLNMTEKSIIKAKDELVNAGLLKQVKGGFNKPAKLYVTDLLTENISAYQDLPKQTKTLDTNLDTKKAPKKQSAVTTVQTPTLDDEINQHASEILNNGVNDTFFENKAITIMERLTGSVAAVRELIGVILNAKKHTEKKRSTFLLLDENDESITFTLRCIVEAHKNKGIKNLKGFVYKSFVNLFDKRITELV